MNRASTAAWSGKHAMLVPTALLLIATVLIGKIALAGPTPLVALPVSTASPPEISAPPSPTPVRPVVIVREVAPLPPVCVTELPGSLCVSSVPECSELTLATPDIICQWPRDPAWPPH